MPAGTMPRMNCVALILALSLAARTDGFAPPQSHRATRTSSLRARINQSIDLDSPKVATQEKLADGDKKVYCRCWQSGTFPLCDGAHMAHNKETGDNVAPLILTAKSAAAGSEVEASSADEEKTTTVLGKLKTMFKKKEDPDGLTTKERLAKMGLSALLSYGFGESNACNDVSVEHFSLNNYSFSLFYSIKHELCRCTVLVLVRV